MQITDEWLESIKDEQGLTNGQIYILGEWNRRLAFVGYGHLPRPRPLRLANFGLLLSDKFAAISLFKLAARVCFVALLSDMAGAY